MNEPLKGTLPEQLANIGTRVAAVHQAIEKRLSCSGLEGPEIVFLSQQKTRLAEVLADLGQTIRKE